MPKAKQKTHNVDKKTFTVAEAVAAVMEEGTSQLEESSLSEQDSEFDSEAEMLFLEGLDPNQDRLVKYRCLLFITYEIIWSYLHDVH